MIKISNELKLAIVQMPQEEKDKILLRLIAKDEKLVQKLQFELLEGNENLEQRRMEIRNYISNSMVLSNGIDTPGWLLMCLRDCNARITEHTKATKDKSGQISMSLFMLNKAFSVFDDLLMKMQKRADTFAPYVVKRATDLLTLIKKMPIMEQAEFIYPMNLLLEHIYEYPPTQKLAEGENLPKRI